MKKFTVVLCVVFAFAACHPTQVDTTPLPPFRIHEDSDGVSESQKDLLKIEKISSPKNKIRTKRGIPCPCVEDIDCEWERNPPCGCDPCDAVRNANEARLLRKQHRKLVTEMKINRLKRKLHTAVCPSCALAHEREMEHKPCNKPHVDITVVVPGGNQHGVNEVPVPVVESLPPHHQTYTQVTQTGSQVFTTDPIYDEPMATIPQYGPMVPELQYEPMVHRPQYEPMVHRPQYEPMVPRPQYGVMVPEAQFEPMGPVMGPQRFDGFGPSVPWMRSAVDSAENNRPMEEVFEQDTKRKITTAERLLTVSVENEKTSTEAPNDSDEAWPFKNATYDEAEPIQHQIPFPTDVTTEAPPYDSREAVPFNYTGSPREYDSSEAVPFNYTGSPREYDSSEAVRLNYTGSPGTYDSSEAVPFNHTGSPRAYDSSEAVPFNYSGPPKAYQASKGADRYNYETPKAHDSGEAIPFNYTGPPNAERYSRDETSLRAPPTDDVLWQTAYLAASQALASALNKSSSSNTLKSLDNSVVRRNCTGGLCPQICLEADCLAVRQKRDTSRMPLASVLLTGLVSAIIGV